ncbi:VOC family protein [Dyadobacter sp. NIV53]|uniref:VOC family protein n=1 Tax=Dyadobacter sp. NIV53 TaxID=2861765 RepID=UPI001C86A595|nr:VOC family protein [Dyadobacter sp. NIV53]
MQKIIPFLWFDGKVEEAMNFYVSVFKNSKGNGCHAANGKNGHRGFEECLRRLETGVSSVSYYRE